jgi:hypothetical protein
MKLTFYTSGRLTPQMREALDEMVRAGALVREVVTVGGGLRFSPADPEKLLAFGRHWLASIKDLPSFAAVMEDAPGGDPPPSHGRAGQKGRGR